MDTITTTLKREWFVEIIDGLISPRYGPQYGKEEISVRRRTRSPK
jgi:hypothetical protein